MNQERAREIARDAVARWKADDDGLRECPAVVAADALHAAYEAELEALRAQVAKREVSPSVIDLPGGWAPDPKMDEWRRNAARLASIKETARGLFASRRVVLVNSAFDQAEHFEETFERRYGGKP